MKDIVERAKNCLGYVRSPDAIAMAISPELVRELVEEIERLRRGEFICSRCHLRKDAEQPEGDPPF